MFENRVAENEHVLLKYKNEILYGKYLIKKLNIHVAKSVMNLQINTFGSGISYVITDLSKVKYVTKEARDYFVKDKFTKNIVAKAFITPTILHKLMITFFTAFNKLVVPSALFTNQQDAQLWITKCQQAQQK